MAATLTADGLNASNGTLNGQYTGTTVNISAYPIGSILSSTWNPCSTTPLLNSTLSTRYVNASSSTVSYTPPSSPVTLAGTWRSRGTQSIGYLIMQRYA